MDSMIYGRIMPSAMDVEKKIIGACLLNEDSIISAMGILKDICFYNEKNKLVFRTILELWDDGVSIDTVTVVERLTKRGILEECGGVSYIIDLTNQVASEAHLIDHCRIVFEKYLYRETIRICSDAVNLSFEGADDVFDMLSNIQSQMIDLVMSVRNSSALPFRDHILKSIEILKQRLAGETSGGEIKSSYKDVDDLFMPSSGDFVVIAGRPSMGKTTFSYNYLHRAAGKLGKTGLFYSGEMSAEKLMVIPQSIESRVPAIKIIRADLTDDEFERVRHASDIIKDLPMIIDDTPNPSLLHIQTEAIKAKKVYDIEWICIDYLQRIKVDGSRGDNPMIDMKKISGALKELARRLEIPVIALSQLSRAVEQRADKRPIMSDLRETGDIEQDADVIVMCFRPEYYDDEVKRYQKNDWPYEGIMELLVRKNRNGKIGKATVFFDKDLRDIRGYSLDRLEPMPVDTIIKPMDKDKYEEDNTKWIES